MSSSDTMPDLLPISPITPGPLQRISQRVGGKNAKEVERFMKFAVVGIIGAIIDLGLTNFLLAVVFHPKAGDDTPVQIATGISFVTAVISNFIWNRYWTYPETQSSPIAPQLAQFFAVNAVGLVIREIVVKLLNAPFATLIGRITGSAFSADAQLRLSANIAIMIALVIVMLWNFFVNRYWTYRNVK